MIERMANTTRAQRLGLAVMLVLALAIVLVFTLTSEEDRNIGERLSPQVSLFVPRPFAEEFVPAWRERFGDRPIDCGILGEEDSRWRQRQFEQMLIDDPSNLEPFEGYETVSLACEQSPALPFEE